MTLGELKEDLRKKGVRSVGVLKINRSLDGNGSNDVTVYFSADEKIVVPFAPKTIYPLVMKTGSDDEPVHIEKIKALKRYFNLVS